MSWKDILKSSSSIRRNWINSKTPPDMYYYDKLNPKLKKEFDEVFDYCPDWIEFCEVYIMDVIYDYVDQNGFSDCHDVIVEIHNDFIEYYG